MSDPRISLGADIADSAGDHILAALDAIRPVIRIGPGLSPAGAAAAAALVVIVARVFPHTAIDGDAALGVNPWNAATVADALARSAAAIPPPTTQPTTDIVISIGSDAAADLYVGGDDWTAIVSTAPVGATAKTSALGLHAAACFAAAEVSKRALQPLGMISVTIQDQIIWNLIDHRLHQAPDPGPARRRPARAAFFGCGSVGSSGAAVLACGEHRTGHAWPVDPDTIDPTRNPFRYPALTGTEHGPKPVWVADMLNRAGWTTATHIGDVATWVASQPAPGIYGLALSSVDTVGGRRDVADLLAETTVSVGVAGLALHVQVEHPADDNACPYCEFVDVRTALEESQVRAELTGLTEHRVIELTAPDATLSEADIAASVGAGRVQAGRAEGLVGRRLEDLIRRVYAQATVPLPNVGATASVTAPHVSWFGGVLLAAEVDKHALGIPLLQRRADFDLAGVPLGATTVRPRDPTGRCVCAQAARREWAQRLYA